MKLDKIETLALYMHYSLTRMVRYDGRKRHVFHPKEEVRNSGRDIDSGEVLELIDFNDVKVRVLMRPDVDPEDVIELLLMIADEIRQDGIYNEQAERERLESMIPF